MSDLAEIAVRFTGPQIVGQVVLLRGGVVRAPETHRWALGLTTEALSAEFKRRGWTATQRRAPAVLVL